MAVTAPLSLLILGLAFSFAVCPVDRPLSVEIEAKTTDKVGKLYRRADVLIFIPIRGQEIVSVKVPLDVKFSIQKLGKNRFGISMRLRNMSAEEVDGARVEQEVEGREFSIGDMKAKRIISKSPYIFEFLNLYPTDIRDNTVIINLPSIRPSEELELNYTMETKSRPAEPRVTIPQRKERREREAYVLVGKYSLMFDYGKVSTQDINLENVSQVIEGLKDINIKPVVRIVGVADGKRSSEESNNRVAKERAMFVAQKIFGQELACYLDSLLASSE